MLHNVQPVNYRDVHKHPSVSTVVLSSLVKYQQIVLYYVVVVVFSSIVLQDERQHWNMTIAVTTSEVHTNKTVAPKD